MHILFRIAIAIAFVFSASAFAQAPKKAVPPPGLQGEFDAFFVKFRDAVKAQWGQKGVIDLTMALQLGRMFPMVKAGLGYAKECRRVTVSGHNVDVVKQAA